MAKQKRSKWKIIAGIILIIQIIVSAVTVGLAAWVNVLPDKYLLLAGLILLWLVCMVYILFYCGGKKKKSKKRRYIKRSIGCVIAALIIAAGSYGSYMLAEAGLALNRITDKDIVTDTVSVYVLKDNPAKTVMDAKDSVFAITENYDYEHTKKAIESINEEVGKEIQTQSYDNVFAMIDALYSGDVDAMVLNEAYVDIIEAQKGYEDFSDRTKTLFVHEEEKVVEEKPQTKEKSITTDTFVIYVSGSDTRNLKLATSRSDVNILVVVNPQTKQVLLVNTPRDYYVQTSVSGQMRDKLTHCGIYGINCSMETLGTLYDEPVDYYVQINFAGFETLVDAIGGITIEAEKSFRTSEGGFYITQGTNQLNGAQALAYARERKSFADGDNARGRHQMQAISAIIAKVSSGTTILNNYSGIMDSMEGMFSTSMSASDISALVKMQLDDMAQWNVKSFAVSGTGSSQVTYSMPTKRSYVMYPDEDQINYARILVDKVIDGVSLSDEDMVMPTLQ